MAIYWIYCIGYNGVDWCHFLMNKIKTSFKFLVTLMGFKVRNFNFSWDKHNYFKMLISTIYSNQYGKISTPNAQVNLNYKWTNTQIEFLHTDILKLSPKGR